MYRNKSLLVLSLVMISLLLSALAFAGDFSDAGYRGGQSHPTSGTIINAGDYGVQANDGQDDTTALQYAIDEIGRSGSYNENNHAILLLPKGEIIISNEIHVDVSGLIIRGQGTDPSTGTKILFKPWKAYSVSNGEPQVDGKIWPGYAAFRVETRVMHPTETNYEGSINFHWKSGVKVDSNGGGTAGSNTIYLASGGAGNFNVGDTAYVGAANTVQFLQDTYVNTSDYYNGHMRTQLFKVTSVDTSNDTITVDKPLEFDIPYSNGGQIGGTTYYSKIMPVTAIRDVGFENFYFEATLDHTEYAGTVNPNEYNASSNPGGVRHRYQNAAPEYAVHGILLKFAENVWVDGIKMHMSASHSIVTEFVHHATIENNYLDGSWNKGKGGHGYFRISKASDSLVKNNDVYWLRHLALQWSTNNTLVEGNYLTADLNLHGGWERNNLIRNNTTNISFYHRSWTESGPENETWFPIWWGAGDHAGGWSGASGPNNMFVDNTLVKQPTEGASYQNWGMYDSAGVVYHIGWNGSQWEHLKKSGNVILTWDPYTDFSVSPNSGVTKDGDTGGTVDPLPPVAPSNLAATAGDGQVDLTWSSVADATSYTVYRSTTSGSGYASIKTGQTSASYTDTGVTNDTTYYYVVKAVNSVGSSNYSNEASATPTSGGTGDGGDTATGSLKLQYDCAQTSTTANSIKPDILFVNTGSSDRSLANVTVRYWFTNETGGTEVLDTRYAESGSMSATFGSANGYRYAEISFGSVTVQANNDLKYKFSIRNTDWSDFNQSDDYSFDGSITSFVDYDKITVYENGTLIWGTTP